MTEYWRPVLGYEGLYEASSLGRIRSLWVAGSGYGHWRIQPLYLRPKFNRFTGYMQVSLNKNGVKTKTGWHRVVCGAFHGPAPTKYDCAHLDGNKTHNHPTNLQWVTRTENASHRYQHGTHICGDDHPDAILTEAEVREIREKYTGKYGEIKMLAQEYGVHRYTISQALRGVRWSHVPNAVSTPWSKQP